MGFSDVDNENKPLSFQESFEAKRSHHLQELQNREDEMRQMFVVRVKEKEAELKEAEKEVTLIIYCVCSRMCYISLLWRYKVSRNIQFELNNL